MKFREVTAQQVGGLTAAALLTAGGGAKWKLRSIRRKLRSTDESVEALIFLLKNPLIFKTFFKEDVRQVARDKKSNLAFTVLAAHDQDGFNKALETLTLAERDTFFKNINTIEDSLQKAKNALGPIGNEDVHQPSMSAVSAQAGPTEAGPTVLTGTSE